MGASLSPLRPLRLVFPLPRRVRAGVLLAALALLGGGATHLYTQRRAAEGQEHLAAAQDRLEASIVEAPGLDRLAASSALSHLTRARERGVDTAEAQALSVRASVLVALQGGDLPSAQRTLAAAVEQHGWDAETHLLAAEIARRAARLTEAEQHLAHTLRLAPRHVRGLMAAASLALEVGDPQASERYARALVRREPEASRAHALLGEALEQQRRFEGAEQAYREALRLNQRDAVGHMDLARVLRVRGDLPGAEASYSQALTLAPADPAAFLGRGLVRMEQGHGPGAASDLERARQLAPRDASVWVALGDLRRAASDLDAAVEAYRHALTLDPGLTMVEVRLGNTHVARGQLEQALAAFDAALERAEQLSEAHNGRGVALMYLGREAEARASFERAAELSPSDPHPLLNLGILGERSGRPDDAERAFQAALDRDPSSEDALERLLALRAG